MQYYLVLFLSLFSLNMEAQRARDFGIQIGVLATGKHNAITDVQDVLVGHQTIIKKKKIKTLNL